VDVSRLLACRCSRREFLVITAGLLVACKTSSEGTSTTAGPAATQPGEATVPGATATIEAAPTATPQPTATPAAPSIEIVGDDDFKAWTQRALEMIQPRAAEAYAEVTASIDIIESVPAGSGMYVEEKRYAVGEQTAYAPGYDEAQQLIWYAGTIVHDAHHSARYIRGDDPLGKDAEIACLTVQKAALELMTDDPFFRDYVQGLIDGADDPANQYWNQPLENRHW
jgi:hypothetical protein